jgi:hypothetical protein
MIEQTDLAGSFTLPDMSMTVNRIDSVVESNLRGPGIGD